jgi:hypothetical protein
MGDEPRETWDERFIKRVKRAVKEGEIAGMLSRLIGEATDNRRGIAAGIAAVVLAPVLLLATLLGASYVEFRSFGTQHIEDACRAIQIHEPIRRLIRAVGPRDRWRD